MLRQQLSLPNLTQRIKNNNPTSLGGIIFWGMIVPLLLLVLVGAIASIPLVTVHPPSTAAVTALCIALVVVVALVPAFVNINARIVQGNTNPNTVLRRAYDHAGYVFGAFGLILLISLIAQCAATPLLLVDDEVYMAASTVLFGVLSFFFLPVMVFAALGVPPLRALTTSFRLMGKAVASHVAIVLWVSVACSVVGVWWSGGDIISTVILVVFTVYSYPALRVVWEYEFPEYPLQTGDHYPHYARVPGDWELPVGQPHEGA